LPIDSDQRLTSRARKPLMMMWMESYRRYDAGRDRHNSAAIPFTTKRRCQDSGGPRD
jgi:hypothetical protein